MAVLPDRLLSLRHLTNAGTHHRGRVDTGGPWSAHLRASTARTLWGYYSYPPVIVNVTRQAGRTVIERPAGRSFS